MSGFLIVLVIGALFVWLTFVRPQRRQQQQQLAMWETLELGDEVVTAGGIYGEITGFEDDDVLLRIAPELEVRVARRAIGGVVSRPVEDDDDAESDDAEESLPEAGSYSEDPR